MDDETEGSSLDKTHTYTRTHMDTSELRDARGLLDFYDIRLNCLSARPVFVQPMKGRGAT